MMRFPYPLYLQQHKDTPEGQQPTAEPSNWTLAWICVAFWGVIVGIALLVKL
ncbi:MAG: hypothetical protein JWQ22_835 [Devosia sp.]|nr:hypothetical protein [Devosia sp.]